MDGTKKLAADEKSEADKRRKEMLKDKLNEMIKGETQKTAEKSKNSRKPLVIPYPHLPSKDVLEAFIIPYPHLPLKDACKYSRFPYPHLP